MAPDAVPAIDRSLPLGPFPTGVRAVLANRLFVVKEGLPSPLLNQIKTVVVVGLTATAKRRDGHQPILHMQIGPVRFDLGRKPAESADSLTKTLVIRETSFTSSAQDTDPSIQSLYGALARDEARTDTLFLAMPISWRGTLVQYAGRLHRPLPGKTEARIVDYVDRQVPILGRMFERRMRGYREIGYRFADSPGSASIDSSLDGGPAPSTEAVT